MKGLRLALVPVVVAVAFGAHRLRGHAHGHHLATQRYEDVYYLPPPEYLRVVSLGHGEAMAGLIWLRALIYFGDELINRGSVKNLHRYADAMLELDPQFKKVYHWVATCSLYRTGDVTVEDARRAVAYLKEGVRRFPDDGELAWDLGANLMWELAPILPEGTERDKVRAEALDHLRVAVLRGEGPTWLPKAVASQMLKEGRREQALRHLKEVLPTVSDPAVRKNMLAQIEELEGAVIADAFQSANEDFARAHHEQYPYLSPTLYLLVAPKPVIDGSALIRRNFDPVGTLVQAGDAAP